MNKELIGERLFHALASGQRAGSRDIVTECIHCGMTAEQIGHEVFWDVLQQVAEFHRQDQISTLSYNYATRLLRSLVDQLHRGYERQPERGRRVLLFTGNAVADEIGGHLMADLLEAAGYEVFFAGGGVARDEILAEVGERRPDTLLMFASAAGDAPDIRVLIDTIRGVGACPEMQIVVGGGVFNRADGLAEEIGADAWARDPEEVLEILEFEPERRATPDQRTVGRNRRVGAATPRAKAA
ncbi:MAG: cobalamin B12-binding domain-containing protein [Planctomycetota bacterium]